MEGGDKTMAFPICGVGGEEFERKVEIKKDSLC